MKIISTKWITFKVIKEHEKNLKKVISLVGFPTKRLSRTAEFINLIISKNYIISSFHTQLFISLNSHRDSDDRLANDAWDSGFNLQSGEMFFWIIAMFVLEPLYRGSPNEAWDDHQQDEPMTCLKPRVQGNARHFQPGQLRLVETGLYILNTCNTF